jgi:hypothetical protein
MRFPAHEPPISGQAVQYLAPLGLARVVWTVAWRSGGTVHAARYE